MLRHARERSSKTSALRGENIREERICRISDLPEQPDFVGTHGPRELLVARDVDFLPSRSPYPVSGHAPDLHARARCSRAGRRALLHEPRAQHITKIPGTTTTIARSINTALRRRRPRKYRRSRDVGAQHVGVPNFLKGARARSCSNDETTSSSDSVRNPVTAITDISYDTLQAQVRPTTDASTPDRDPYGVLR